MWDLGNIPLSDLLTSLAPRARLTASRPGGVGMDFGVYLQITNRLPVPLTFSRFESSEGQCCTYAGPTSIPADGQQHQVHINDPCSGVGAEGTAYFVAEVGGVARQYAWHGNCPVWSSTNQASGPGITSFNRGGHPLTIQIAINSSTTGWTPMPAALRRNGWGLVPFLVALCDRSWLQACCSGFPARWVRLRLEV